MAQRKSPATTSGRSGTSGSAKKASSKAAGSPAGRPTTAGGRPPGRPPTRKPGKSIVNQKQTPWGLIITTVVIVVFAAAIVGFAVTRHSSSNSSASGPAGSQVSNCTAMTGNNTDTYLNELKCAAAIKGVTFKQEPNRNHVEGNITYDATPPVGGNHSQYWADCSGTVYPNAIANENAVHMLEHGAIWITYNKDLPKAQVNQLSSLVNGQDRMAMSPYPGLKSPITLQAWGYQLAVQSASDPRIKQFIAALRYNPKTTPEYGATCSQPTFKDHPSTFGHPLWVPAA